jgi:hypothetical protein
MTGVEDAAMVGVGKSSMEPVGVLGISGSLVTTGVGSCSRVEQAINESTIRGATMYVAVRQMRYCSCIFISN